MNSVIKSLFVTAALLCAAAHADEGMESLKFFKASGMQHGKWQVELGKWNGTIAEVSVNGKPATVIAFPPYNTDISGLIKPGLNKIEVKVIGSLKNLLGPHHNNPKPGLASPGNWRNVIGYPSGADYQMVDYGLFDDFGLVNGI